MDEVDREVIEFIGDQGKTAEQVSDRFPAFDLERLVRTALARPRRTNPVKAQSRQTPPAHEHDVLRAHVSRSRGNRPGSAHASLRLRLQP